MALHIYVYCLVTGNGTFRLYHFVLFGKEPGQFFWFFSDTYRDLPSRSSWRRAAHADGYRAIGKQATGIIADNHKKFIYYGLSNILQ